MNSAIARQSSSIVATLVHIVDVASDAARRATGSDDGRTVRRLRLGTDFDLGEHAADANSG